MILLMILKIDRVNKKSSILKGETNRAKIKDMLSKF